MSRAFVKESDNVEEYSERPISASPNFATERGIRLMEDSIESLRAELAEAQRLQDRSIIARASRDLRYWTQRRTTAQRIDPPDDRSKAAFATRVTLARDDGRQQCFTIVGEDEADPAQGLIAYNTPIARAVLGQSVGDTVEIVGGESEILAIE